MSKNKWIIIAVVALGLLIIAGINTSRNVDRKLASKIYSIKSSANGISFQPKVPTAYTFSIVDGRGETLRDFATVHTKIMHVIAVRKDLYEFQHIHPAYNADSGEFSFSDLTFPSDGPYRIFADFTPKDAQVVTIFEDISVGDLTKYTPQSLGGEEHNKTFQGYDVELSIDPDSPVSGRGTMLTFQLQKDGKPVTDLETYLGALGHTVVLRESDLQFIHAHPMMDNVRAQTGTVQFMVTFPQGGRYKLFSQFQREGKVLTTDFVVSVAQGEVKEQEPPPPAEHEEEH